MADAVGNSEISTKIDEGGNYKIRVLMPTSAALRIASTAKFILKIEVISMK